MPNGTSQSSPKVGFSLDSKTAETIKWSAIFSAVQRVVVGIIGWIGFRFFAGGLVGRFGGFFTYTFPVGQLVGDLIWGAVGGAVFGFILAKQWGWFQNLNRKTIKAKNFFMFMFIFDVVVSVLLTLLLSFTAFVVGFLPLIFNLAGLIIVSWIYAQGMSKKVGNLYPV